jgi:drug/metabolite transporter (DMT)-like permease
MGPFFALSAGCFFGAGDFLGGFASQRAPAVLVLAASQLVGLIGVAIWLVLASDPLPPRSDLLAAAGAGVAGSLGILALYSGLSIGAMAIVAPVSAMSPAVPLIADVAQGKTPQTLQLIGMAVAVTGVVILSRDSGKGTATRFAAGFGLALVAALCFGLFDIGLDAGSDASVPWAAAVARLAGSALAITAAVAMRRSAGPLFAIAPIVLLIGLFDTAGNVAFALASTRGLVSVAATLSSLYPVVTVALAVALLGERPSRPQVGGAALALVGATLLAL